jgi:hypothetical protein
MCWLFLKQRERFLARARIHTGKPHAGCDCHAQTADALFIIHD